MGQKVNPNSLRITVNKKWKSRWYADKNYAQILEQDLKIKNYINKNLKHAGISKVEIYKVTSNIKVVIYAARPGIIIGRKGEEAEKTKRALENLTKEDLIINIKEVKRPEMDAQLISDNIVRQIEKRIAYRRVIKRTLQNTMKYNVGGCKIMVSGRLNGAEMARTEWVKEGRIPLHTLKANIDYAIGRAETIYGIIGVKVWVYKGEFGDEKLKSRRNVKRSK